MTSGGFDQALRIVLLPYLGFVRRPVRKTILSTLWNDCRKIARFSFIDKESSHGYLQKVG